MSDETQEQERETPSQPAERRNPNGGVYTPGASRAELNEAARTGGKITRLKHELKQTQAERDRLALEHDALKKEADGLRTRADTSITAKEVDRLKTELRGLRHRQEFDRLALAAGVRPEALADAWDLSRYAPEKDEVDAAKLGEVIEAQKQARPYLFATPADPNAPAPKPEPKPAPASGKGAAATGAPVAFDLERAASDPGYVMRNYDKYTAANAAAAAASAVER